jgi:hypothetical protein
MATYTASATTGTSCACCGTLDAATLQCRTRGGTATLCGYSEYTSASTPPKKYRERSFSGVVNWDKFKTNCAGGIACQYNDTFSGEIIYDLENCDTSGTGVITRSFDENAPGSGVLTGVGDINGNPGTYTINYTVTKVGSDLILDYTTTATGGGIYLSVRFCCGSGANGLFPSGGIIGADLEIIAIYTNSSNILVLSPYPVIRAAESCAGFTENISSISSYVDISRFSVSESATSRVATISGAACQVSGGYGFAITNDPSIEETLSEEDTDQNAIDRLLAGAGGEWSGWLSPGATGCTGSPPPCCLARWEERTDDFDFIYQESEFRVTASGLTPSTTYNARVDIQRRTFGSGSYALFQTVIVSGTTDGSGNFQEDGEVPNEEGFESYASAAYIVIPS